MEINYDQLGGDIFPNRKVQIRKMFSFEGVD